MNLTDQPATISATFYSDTGTPFSITQTLSPFRRGGLDVNQLPLVPSGLYSVHVTSNQPIVAALSQYRVAPGRGDTEAGVVAGGSLRGVLPGAMIPGGGQSTVSAVFAGTAPGTVTIDLDFVLSDGTVLTAPAAFALTASNPRADADLSTLNGALPRDQFFTIRYHVRSDAAPVSLAYTSIADGDTVTTPFLTATTETTYFAGGFTDPSNSGTETISLYNPFTDPTLTVTYRLKFHFVNDQQDEIVIPTGGTGTIAPHQRVDISVRALAEVLARIQSDPRFHAYSITVETTVTSNSTPMPGGIFAQLTRIDSAEGGGGVTTFGPSLDNSATAVFITDPRFS
jgi:hypothetical protein